jgi:hypothetical protein
MPRYLVERTLFTTTDLRVETIVELNADSGVTWVHSYVSDDASTMFCVYEALSPEAVRNAARRCGLSVDRITKVRVLDPYSYDTRGKTE